MSANGKSALVSCPDHGTVSIPHDALRECLRRGLVELAGESLKATPPGRAFVAREEGAGGFAAQQRELVAARIEVAGAEQDVVINAAESPLARLAGIGRRADGFLAAGEFRAGERLRRDYTYGRIMPRMSANWEASVSVGRRAAGGGQAELTETALAARQRVERALTAVGPELAGVVIDVCCYLKGLEQVEVERRWPRRSAKLMLKAGLSVLHRHYEPPARTSARPLLHWGSSDYRPPMSRAG